MGDNYGELMVGGSLTTLFTQVEALEAIQENRTAGFYVINAKQNSGIIYDTPQLTLGGGNLNVELARSITLPLTMSAEENPSGYTVLCCWFDYLPTAAMPVKTRAADAIL